MPGRALARASSECRGDQQTYAQQNAAGRMARCAGQKPVFHRSAMPADQSTSRPLIPTPWGAACTQAASGVVVRETPCKTLLQRTSLGDYSLNCYTGCAHGCAYCYARFIERFHPHPEPWGAFVDVKINAVEVLKRQLRRAPPGEVFVSSACDGWQPVEEHYRLTRRCCQLLLEHGFEVHVLSKSPLVCRDLDVLAQGKSQVGTTLTTLDEDLRALWEPRAGSVAARLALIDAAQQAGIETAVMFGPLLPALSDSETAIAALLEQAAARAVSRIWVDALNPRPRVWPALSELLRKHFPDLLAHYRRVLFDRALRRDYLAELRQRVEQQAARLGLASRVSVCF